MQRLSRRAVLLGGGAVAGGWLTRRWSARNPTLQGVTWIKPKGGASFLNDASELSETPIHRHIVMSQDPGTALVNAIRAEIKDAAEGRRPVNVGAARHSMGGQAIPRGGHAITFDNGLVELDRDNATMRVHAGARWSQVIAALDPSGFGPKVMQSNNDFGVAATFCVNAHGWPVKLGPMGATVRSFDMVLPDGGLVSCSRNQNADLFGMTMGGYGLTGAITSMEVDASPNRRLVPTFEAMRPKEFGARFVAALEGGDVNMAYGRLNVDRGACFEEALMITYREAGDQANLPPASGSGIVSKLARHLYRAQLGNERMKRLRWWTETDFGPMVAGDAATRNSLINEPVVTLDDRDPDRTDILHEYFVSPDKFADFIVACQQIIPASYQEFLNVTLRFVDADPDSWLAYAPVPRIAAVMSFSQEMTARAEADMTRLTRRLIEAITSIGGSYYLPYRPHATPDQMVKAYPNAARFVRAKRELDPDLRFRNNLWDSYLGTIG